MKKMLILAVLVVALVGLVSGTALAGSWWVVNSNKAGDVPGWNANSSGLTWNLDVLSSNGPSLNARADAWYYRNNGDTVSETTRTSVNGDFILSAGTPHGGYSTTTGLCKTCHAVHDGGNSSYRLLKSGGADANATGATGNGRSPGEGGNAGFGTERSNECMYCHDADSGFSPMRPYGLAVVTTVRGEHTNGSTVLPDANGATLKDRDPNDATAAVLACYQCHSVHGANTMGTATVGNSKWGEMILRLDPNGDGTNMGLGVTGAAYTGPTADNNATRTAFCSDCHQGNSNWNATDTTPRANPASHVQGAAADGTLEVYGDLTKVAQADSALDGANATDPASWTAGSAPRAASTGCRGCHSADDTGTEQKELTGLQGTWPHQSIGPKLLNDLLSLTGSAATNVRSNAADTSIAGTTNDADRSLINGDAVCLRCHSENRDGTGTWAVGRSF